MTAIGWVDNFVPLIAAEAGLWQFHATRSLLALPLVVVLARLSGARLRPHNPAAVALRTAAFAGSMVLYFGALAFLPIAVVGAGLFTAPIFVQLLSALLFGVALGPWRIAAVAVGFAGVVALLRPWEGGLSLMALMPVGAGFLYAVAGVLTRHLCAQESPFTLLAGFFLAMGLIGLGGLALLPAGRGADFLTTGLVWPGPAFWLWTAVQAVVSVLAVGMITRAYQIAEPSYVSVFEYWFLVAASGFAWLLWGQALDGLMLAGMTLIALAGLVIILRARSEGA
ncbi:MAG: DMT family transporter [Alphaproteobacteria bacterium]|nr:MAG: DMT family transporter [Alphaproteobacteria bacterium]